MGSNIIVITISGSDLHINEISRLGFLLDPRTEFVVGGANKEGVCVQDCAKHSIKDFRNLHVSATEGGTRAVGADFSVII